MITPAEAVVVHYDAGVPLKQLIDIHLMTHSSSSHHALRNKYRSAVYYFTEEQRSEATLVLKNKKVITKLLPFRDFILNHDNYLNYYRNKPSAPFSKTYIRPKLMQVKCSLGEHYDWHDQ